MNKKFITIIFVSILCLISGTYYIYNSRFEDGYGAPPYLPDAPPSEEEAREARFDLENWQRPPGPLRVGIQAGHWKNNELPDELEALRGNSGTSHKGIPEWQANLAIAENLKELLVPYGIEVDILPSTIPKSYYADAVVAIHADGSLSPNVRGYKVGSPRRDRSGKAKELEQIMSAVYGEFTKLPRDPNVTRNMTGYYAFSWRRFDHSTHPMAPSIIVETGFLTNSQDRKIILDSQIPAKAIAEGLKQFLGIT